MSRVVGLAKLATVVLITLALGACERSVTAPTVATMAPRLDAGSRVYIHCEHGVGRSALLALCVLVSRGDPPLGALERAKSARWQVSPSPEQLGEGNPVRHDQSSFARVR